MALVVRCREKKKKKKSSSLDVPHSRPTFTDTRALNVINRVTITFVHTCPGDATDNY